MTSKALADLLAGNRTVGTRVIEISPSDVYAAATMAQEEILSEIDLLDGTCALVLVPSKSLYSYPPVAITAVLQPGGAGTDYQITIPAHTFATGDEIILTPTNVHFIVTVVDADNVSLDSSGTATSPAVDQIVIHAISQASHIKADGITKLSDSTQTLNGSLEKKSKLELEQLRLFFGTDIDSSTVLYYTEFQADPVTFEILTTPSLAILTEVSFYRKPLASERISETVDPILNAATYNQILIQGTLALMFEVFKSNIELGQFHRKRFEDLKQSLSIVAATRRVTPTRLRTAAQLSQSPGGNRW
jgi:hypothetical protein